MKILKQLSKFFIILFLSSTFFKTALTNEPVDIWNIEKKDSVIKKKLIENNEIINNENIQGTKITKIAFIKNLPTTLSFPELVFFVNCI